MAQQTGKGVVLTIATEEKFESVGFVTGISDGKFEGSFVATISNGDKLYGSKNKQDGSPAKVWPLIRQSLADEKYYKWTGNLKTSENGSFKKVTFGFDVEPGPGEQPTWTPDDTPDSPNGNTNPGAGFHNVTVTSNLPPEIAKPLQGAYNAKHKQELDSFTFGSLARIVAGLAAAGKVETDGAMGLLFNYYEQVTGSPIPQPIS